MLQNPRVKVNHWGLSVG